MLPQICHIYGEASGEKLNKLASLGLAIIATSGMLLAGIPSATAAQNSAAESKEIQAASNFYSEYGVTDRVKKNLLAKQKNGQISDALKIGAKPVATQKSVGVMEDTTVLTYADGSIQVAKQEKPEPALRDLDATVVPMYVGQCRNSASGSGYRIYYDCLVTQETVAIAVAMRADYSIYQGAYDRIARVFNGYSSSYGGVASVPTLRVQKAIESASGPSWATATGTYTTGPNTRTYQLNFYVGGDSARTTLAS